MPKIDGIDKEVNAVGTISSFAGGTLPTGWLVCDGSVVSRTAYPKLFEKVGTAWGEGDGSTTFHLPDLRGRSVRGKDDGAGRDPDAGSRTASNTGGNTGDDVGSVQDDSMQGHHHQGYYYNNSAPGGGGGGILLNNNNNTPTNNNVRDAITDSVNGTPRTSGETRSKNASVNFIIRVS